jgi:hypothetical protein
MQKQRATPSSYHFIRANTYGLIQVLNGGWYVMAEYSERTGGVKWQRVVLATQRETIERWLREHYPVLDSNCQNAAPHLSKRHIPAGGPHKHK